jgi:SAM-dependent methyltransferase
MTSAGRRPSPRRAPEGAPRRQAHYWDQRYRSDPTLFGADTSPFLQWVLSAIEGRTQGRTWVELGSGYGRDLGTLHRRGHSVRGVDLSRVGTALARRAGLAAVRGHALHFLTDLPEKSVEVVYSNLFFNMEFSEDDHDRLFAQVHRVLVPGGYHAYSVRSVSDRWYGKGVPLAPDMFDLAPDGPVMHFFSRNYARHLRRRRFRNVRSWEGTEDPGEFPIRVLYVLDQKIRGNRA